VKKYDIMHVEVHSIITNVGGSQCKVSYLTHELKGDWCSKIIWPQIGSNNLAISVEHSKADLGGRVLFPESAGTTHLRRGRILPSTHDA
jgi:hypothetical protein